MSRKLFVLLCMLVIVERCGSRRGGIGIGRSGGGFGSRGMSASRSSSAARSRGGLFSGGSKISGGSRASGGGLFGGGTHRAGHATGTGTGGGGWLGGSGHQKTGFGRGTSKWGHTPRTSSHSRSGIGSALRSNTFKNAIVGAAAGYLTYQAGKALIRSAVAPMMWNHRPYYWGMNHYPSSYPRSNVCRMPIDESDPKFGNVFYEDGVTRPREIVWSCDHGEYCCGYECCPASRSNWGWGYGGASSYWRLGIGALFLISLLLCCGLYSCGRLGSGGPVFLRPVR